jgi:hypothetical protein
MPRGSTRGGHNTMRRRQAWDLSRTRQSPIRWPSAHWLCLKHSRALVRPFPWAHLHLAMTRQVRSQYPLYRRNYPNFPDPVYLTGGFILCFEKWKLFSKQRCKNASNPRSRKSSRKDFNSAFVEWPQREVRAGNTG